MGELYVNVPCRETQISELLELLGEYDEPLPCSIFISGSMGTGKSLCVTTILKFLNYKHVFVDCIECYSDKIMYETILSNLDENFTTDARCDSLLDFTIALNHLALRFNKYEPVIIVFERAERLRHMDQSIMCALIRLRELCHLNICTIFLTHLVYDNFHFKVGVREPITIYFTNYNKEELFKIIFLHHKAFVQYVLINNKVSKEIKEELEKPELFGNFLNAFLSVFYRPCRDLIELQYMARDNFVKFCEPIIANEIKVHDMPRLWRHVAPIMKSNLELLYLRISSNKCPLSSDKENNNNADLTTDKFVNTIHEEFTTTKTFAPCFELPYYTKFLLIAAYLASYNPPKEDKRLFMKNHGKQRKRLQQVKAKAKINEKLNTQLGPKAFTLDRLLAIFYAILQVKLGLTSNLLAQITTLVELKLLAGSKEIDLNTTHYNCLVGYVFISAIAQTVSFNVKKYLYDFI